MASKSLILDIDQNFCQCCVCLDQFKEPKLLPCLHRFCSECLEQLIRVNPETLPCPVCREECEVLEEGIDGFKVDFNMKNIVDFLELQKSLEDEQVRKCIGCASIKSVVAYCFKCTDFLCEQCHKYHVDNNMMKDHREHILSLKDVESGNITLQKLVSLKEAPRCKTHPENLSQLCCSTCADLPICVACIFGQRHKVHEIHDVIDLAKTKKDTLSQNLTLLNSNKDELYHVINCLNKTRSTILTNINEKMELLQKQYKDDKTVVDLQRKEVRSQKEIEELEAKSYTETEIKKLRENMEAEIRQTKEKYNKLCLQEQEKCEARLTWLEERLERDEAKLEERKYSIEENMRRSKESLKREEKEDMLKNSEELQHFDGTIKRLENLNATASCILAANDDWMCVQCIPDVCSAVQQLLKDMKKKGTESRKFSISLVPEGSDDNHEVDETFQITLKDDKSSAYIGKIRSEGWKVLDMVSIANTIVIFGETKILKRKFISLHDMNGDLLRRTKMTFCDKPLCVGFNGQMIAMAFKPRVIASFNIFNDDLQKRNTKDDLMDKFLDADCTITCIGADEKNEEVLVGFSYSSTVIRYDKDLDYCSRITLPNKIHWPTGVAAAGGDTIVCGAPNYSIAFILNRRGEIMHEFDGNDPEQTLTSMLSVDADENGLFFVAGCNRINKEFVMVMYGDNKKNPKAVRPLVGDLYCLTKSNNTRKILMIDPFSGFLTVQELYRFNIPE